MVLSKVSLNLYTLRLNDSYGSAGVVPVAQPVRVSAAIRANRVNVRIVWVRLLGLKQLWWCGEFAREQAELGGFSFLKKMFQRKTHRTKRQFIPGDFCLAEQTRF